MGAAVDPAVFQAELVHVGHRAGWGLLAGAVMAFAAWKVRALTIGGAVVSTIIGAAIFSFGGIQGFLMYLAASTVAVTTWRVGQRRRGPTPASHGAGSAMASGAIGVIGALLIAAIDADTVGALILTSAVAAWASTAVAVEFDKGLGKGVGVIASLITAITLAGLFALAFPAMRQLAPFIVLGVAGGLLIHRLARVGRNGLLNEDAWLFLNTLVAAVISYVGLVITT
jgi:uncharacterized membrane protein